MSSHSVEEMSAEELANKKQEQAVMQEMLPYFIYAAIPIALTIALAWCYGPSM